MKKYGISGYGVLMSKYEKSDYSDIFHDWDTGLEGLMKLYQKRLIDNPTTKINGRKISRPLTVYESMETRVKISEASSISEDEFFILINKIQTCSAWVIKSGERKAKFIPLCKEIISSDLYEKLCEGKSNLFKEFGSGEFGCFETDYKYFKGIEFDSDKKPWGDLLQKTLALNEEMFINFAGDNKRLLNNYLNISYENCLRKKTNLSRNEKMQLELFNTCKEYSQNENMCQYRISLNSGFEEMPDLIFPIALPSIRSKDLVLEGNFNADPNFIYKR